MRPYARQYNPASNAHGWDSSPRHNKAPQGVRVKGKASIRRTEKKASRQDKKKQIAMEMLS
ncbi:MULTISPECIES: hypothetical protein [Vibrio harveyi group]|uniref:Uncharacterized protein n=1 Tax=Vibrio owensii CAIM 1854 = LMG 25443 TaxID=1229493 RepID=A0A0C1ZAN0_9VIBR|nr:hypothetical protein [Vibrio owensii]KIF53224.1 hypothetical protein H735_09855 [Vibrio owensii CAIM 1854 = LMG 25443]